MTGIGIRMHRHRQVICLAMAGFCAGCAREPDPVQRYVPPPELARAAVDAVLSDWQEGRSLGSIDRLVVKIQVSDNQRRKGQKLEEFEILGEVPSATPRCFAVRLRFSQPEAEEKVRYVVVGIDPLWVFRQEDIDMLSHWDHPMPSETTEGAEAGIVEERPKTVDEDPKGGVTQAVDGEPPPEDDVTEPSGGDPARSGQSGPPHER
jgi:hypothetical protein